MATKETTTTTAAAAAATSTPQQQGSSLSAFLSNGDDKLMGTFMSSFRSTSSVFLGAYNNNNQNETNGSDDENIVGNMSNRSHMTAPAAIASNADTMAENDNEEDSTSKRDSLLSQLQNLSSRRLGEWGGMLKEEEQHVKDHMPSWSFSLEERSQPLVGFQSDRRRSFSSSALEEKRELRNSRMRRLQDRMANLSSVTMSAAAENTGVVSENAQVSPDILANQMMDLMGEMMACLSRLLEATDRQKADRSRRVSNDIDRKTREIMKLINSGDYDKMQQEAKIKSILLSGSSEIGNEGEDKVGRDESDDNIPPLKDTVGRLEEVFKSSESLSLSAFDTSTTSSFPSLNNASTTSSLASQQRPSRTVALKEAPGATDHGRRKKRVTNSFESKLAALDTVRSETSPAWSLNGRQAAAWTPSAGMVSASSRTLADIHSTDEEDSASSNEEDNSATSIDETDDEAYFEEIYRQARKEQQKEQGVRFREDVEEVISKPTPKQRASEVVESSEATNSAVARLEADPNQNSTDSFEVAKAAFAGPPRKGVIVFDQDERETKWEEEKKEAFHDFPKFNSTAVAKVGNVGALKSANHKATSRIKGHDGRVSNVVLGRTSDNNDTERCAVGDGQPVEGTESHYDASNVQESQRNPKNQNASSNAKEEDKRRQSSQGDQHFQQVPDGSNVYVVGLNDVVAEPQAEQSESSELSEGKGIKRPGKKIGMFHTLPKPVYSSDDDRSDSSSEAPSATTDGTDEPQLTAVNDGGGYPDDASYGSTSDDASSVQSFPLEAIQEVEEEDLSTDGGGDSNMDLKERSSDGVGIKRSGPDKGFLAPPQRKTALETNAPTNDRDMSKDDFDSKMGWLHRQHMSGKTIDYAESLSQQPTAPERSNSTDDESEGEEQSHPMNCWNAEDKQ